MSIRDSQQAKERSPILSCSAPANILLFGEYAILERGGLGIASAISPRIYAFASQADSFTLTGITSGEPITVTEETIATHPCGECKHFLAKLLKILLEILSSYSYPRKAILPIWEITIDASACYEQSGRKLGLGSSAATTVLLTTILLAAQEKDVRKRDQLPLVSRRKIFNIALQAHRRVRGGGSGYDIAASACGSTLLFCGGRRPHISPCKPPWNEESLGLLYGSASIDSAEAVRRYRIWKMTEQRAWHKFIRHSNHTVSHLIRAQSGNELLALINRSRELQIYIGDEIGVSAEFTSPASKSEWPLYSYKTVGAGNELAVAFYPADYPAHNQLEIEQDGIRWEH